MSSSIRTTTTWLLVAVMLLQSSAECFARGGRGGGPGGGFMGGGGAFRGGGGGGNFGGGHFRGGNAFRGGGAPNFGGGGGGFRGGSIPSQAFRQPSFNAPRVQQVPQMRSNFSVPQANRGFNAPSGGPSFRNLAPQGGQFRGPNLSQGARIQSLPNFPARQLQAGQNFPRVDLQPNRGLYGGGGNFTPQAGIAGRMQQGFGPRISGPQFTNPQFNAPRLNGPPSNLGTLANSNRGPVRFGNDVGRFGRSDLSGLRSIGGPQRFAAQNQIGGRNFAPLGGLPNSHRHAQFVGHHGGFGNNANAWGLHHGHGNQGNWNNGNWNHGNWNRGNWNNGNWGANYRNVVVNNNYYGWYNRPWGGLWGFGWYYPYYRSALGWGLGPYYSPWGFGYGSGYGYGGGYYGGYGAYYNPYCAYAPQIVYTNPLGPNYYAQPLALPLTDATQQQPQPQPQPADAVDPQTLAAFRLVEQGRRLFRNGDYRGALDKYDAAIPDLKTDPVVHELRALALFALGDYHESAATLNALLAVAPGMDWTSLRNQYPDVGTYTKQLRALETFLRENPNDAAGRFVLGYHYLVTNFPDAAAVQFQKVVALEPRDAVAKKLVDSLTKGQNDAAEPAPNPAEAARQTDLVGRWVAKSEDGSQFDVIFDQDGGFLWSVKPPQGAPIKQQGKFTATPDRLILDSTGQQESLIARVESRGPNHFRLWVNDTASIAFRRDGANEAEPLAAGKPGEGPILPEAPIPARGTNPPPPREPVIDLPSPDDETPADAEKPGI